MSNEKSCWLCPFRWEFRSDYKTFLVTSQGPSKSDLYMQACDKDFWQIFTIGVTRHLLNLQELWKKLSTNQGRNNIVDESASIAESDTTLPGEASVDEDLDTTMPVEPSVNDDLDTTGPVEPSVRCDLASSEAAMPGSFSDSFAEQKKRLGPICGTYFGLDPVITIFDTDIMRKIYTKEFHSFPERTKSFTRLNGKDMNQALLPSKGAKWKRTRSALSPTFSVSKIKQTTYVIEECVEQTLKVLDNIWQNEKEVLVKKLFSNLSLDAIISSALGTKVNVQSPDGVDARLTMEIRNLFTRGFAGDVGFISMLFPPLERVFEKLGYGLYPTKSLQYARDFTNAVIEDRLKTGTRRMDLLQLMLDVEVPETEITEGSTKGLTRTEIIGNAMLMIGAAFDNTSNVMTNLIYSLAFHPEIQTRLQAEIDEAYRSKGQFNYETVRSLKFLDMCVNETMRLYPSLLVNSRVCRSDTVVNGLLIPKDILVQIPMYFLAHDPDYWEDPWEFKPDRMEDMTQIDSMMFQPFGAGPRNCIGMKFAEMEIKIAMCQILHKYSFAPCADTPKPPLQVTYKLGITPKEEFKLRLMER